MVNDRHVPVRLVMLGAPGAGKGTQAEMFAKAKGALRINAPSPLAGRNEIGWSAFTKRPAITTTRMSEIFKIVEPF